MKFKKYRRFRTDLEDAKREYGDSICDKVRYHSSQLVSREAERPIYMILNNEIKSNVWWWINEDLR